MKKRMLFIAPSFFSYYKRIEAAFRGQGFDIDTIINPTSFTYKLLEQEFRYSALFNRYCINYYNKYKKKLADHYDVVFVIKATKFPLELIEYLKNKYTEARYIQYLWDDVYLDPQSLNTLKYFDKNLSFNRYDCEKYNLIWRPFFYDNSIFEMCVIKDIDLLFVGSYKPERFQFIKKFSDYARQNNLSYKIILKASIFIFLMKIEHFKYLNYFSSKGVSYEQMIKLLYRSKCSIEIPNSGQVGLTTRPFESLMTKTKIVTSNKDIVNYDFYNPNNILVIDPKNIIISKEWIDIPYVDVDNEIVEKYSITTFVTDILK